MAPEVQLCNMVRRLISLSNIGLPGLLVFMFAMLIAIQGIVLIIISGQNLDQKSLFLVFNQSVVENRERNKAETAFREVQLQDIQESQNRTRQLMPGFINSINEISDIKNTTDEMKRLIEFLGSNYDQDMIDATFEEFNTTQQMNQSIQETNQKLDRVIGLISNESQ